MIKLIKKINNWLFGKPWSDTLFVGCLFLLSIYKTTMCSIILFSLLVFSIIDFILTCMDFYLNRQKQKFTDQLASKRKEVL